MNVDSIFPVRENLAAGPPAVADGAAADAARFWDELYGYLGQRERENIRMFGMQQPASHRWLLPSEATGHTGSWRIAPNNVGCVAPGGEWWALLRKALRLLPWTAGLLRVFLSGAGSYCLGAALRLATALAVVCRISPAAALGSLPLCMANSAWTLQRWIWIGEPSLQALSTHSCQCLSEGSWSRPRVTLVADQTTSALSLLAVLSRTYHLGSRAASELAATTLPGGWKPGNDAAVSRRFADGDEVR